MSKKSLVVKNGDVSIKKESVDYEEYSTEEILIEYEFIVKDINTQKNYTDNKNDNINNEI